MDRITKAFVDSFVSDYELGKEESAVQFEHFANYAIIDPHIENHYDVKDEILEVVRDDGELLKRIKLVIQKIDKLNGDLSTNEVSKSKKFVTDCIGCYK